MLSNGMEIYTDGTYKMGLYVEGSNPTLELGNTRPHSYRRSLKIPRTSCGWETVPEATGS